MRQTNAGLQAEARRREQMEALLRTSHAELERRVEQRTAELLDANHRLEQEILSHKQTVMALQRGDVLYRWLNEELEQHVAERTAELTASIAELESFSYSISHDLRAPLRAINGYAAILREDYAPKLGAKGTELLLRIEVNAGKMARLVDGLLDFSRLARAETAAAEVDTEEIVKTVVHDLCAEIDGRKPDVSIGALPKVQGDAVMLRQVWVNLLSNAIKFSSDGAAPRIRVDATQEDGEVVFSVSDNGVGFDMAYADKLFGVFSRLHAVAEFPGVGVGLAIVRRIVERHGGRVWARSAEGAGATFYFSIPAAK